MKKKLFYFLCLCFILSLLDNTISARAQTTTQYDFEYDNALHNRTIGDTIYYTAKCAEKRFIYKKILFVWTPTLKSVAKNYQLGTIRVEPVFYWGKTYVNGQEFQALGYRLSTNGGSRFGDFKSYPYEVKVKVGPVNYLCRCMKEVTISPFISTGDTSYEVENSKSFEIGYGLGKEWASNPDAIDLTKVTKGVDGKIHFGISNKRSWNQSCITLTPYQSLDENAVWEYNFEPDTPETATQCNGTNYFNGLLTWVAPGGIMDINSLTLSVSDAFGICTVDGDICHAYSNWDYILGIWVSTYKTSKWFGNGHNTSNSRVKIGK